MVRALVLELFESFGSEYVREQLFKNIKHVIKLVNDAPEVSSVINQFISKTCQRWFP